MKKRIVSMVLVLCLLFVHISNTVYAEELYSTSGKNVTGFLAPVEEADVSAIEISTAADLMAISNNMRGSYVLKNDIDLSGFGEWIPIGTTGSAFCGKFDGQGHKITGMKVSKNSLIATHEPVGLFGVCNGAQIKNVAIENANVSTSVSSGYNSGANSDVVYVGGLVGHSSNSTAVYNCYVSGSVIARSEGEGRSHTYAGGLIGRADTTVVSYSYNRGSVQAYNGDATTSYNAYAGGLIGIVGADCIIDRSYNSGAVKAETQDYGIAYAGGLISHTNNVKVTDCFNEGQVQALSGNMFCDGNVYAGGIAGFFSGTIDRVYNSGIVRAQAEDSWGIGSASAYAGGICAVSTTSSSISNSAIVQPTVSSSAPSGKHQYRVSNQGTKSNNITINSYTSGSTNDASFSIAVEDMKVSDNYENILGWNFEKVWKMADGKDFPQLRQVEVESEVYKQEYVSQHLAFMEGSAYQDFIENERWAQIYWSAENNFESNATGLLYVVVDKFVDFATLEWGDLFDGDDPFKMILADYISNQSLMDEMEKIYLEKYHLIALDMFGDIKDFLKPYFDSGFDELTDAQLFWLFHYKDKPSEVWISEDFYKKISDIVANDRAGFASKLGLTGETIDDILDSAEFLQAGVESLNGLFDYAVSMSSYRATEDDFKKILAEMCNHLPDDGSVVESLYKMKLKNALESYVEFDEFSSEDVVQFELEHYYDFINNWKDHAKFGAIFFSQKIEDTVEKWLENVLTPKAHGAYIKLKIAIKATWTIMEFLTKNGDIQFCRELLRANAYFEETMYHTLRFYENQFKESQDFSDACMFDAAFKFFKETEIASMDIVIQYFDTYQTSWVSAIKNGSDTFMNSAIEQVHVKKLFNYKTYCHGMSYELGGKVITIACPTNVCVYDEAGNLAASIKDSVVEECRDGIFAYTADEVKLIAMPTDQEYRVEIEATDEGTMSYSISEYDENGKNIQQTAYVGIPISVGETYIGTVNTEIGEEPTSYNLSTGSGEVIDDFEVITEATDIPIESLEIVTYAKEMEIGESMTVEAEIFPANATRKTLVWTTSDENVISVDEMGKIMALGSGEAVITVNSLHGGFSDSVIVSVSESEPTICISKHPKDASYFKDSIAEPLIIEYGANTDKAVQIQWYKALQEDLEDAAVIEGAVQNSYIPNTTNIGKQYYYAEIFAEGETYRSEIAVIEVLEVHQEKVYYITYELNGGIQNTNNPQSYVSSDKDILLLAPQCKGYQFDGWYRDRIFTERMEKIPTGSSGNIKVFAKWNANTYVVKFDANGGQGSMESMQNRKYGESFELTENTFIRDGYKFASWNIKPDSTGIRYRDGESVKNLTSSNNEIVILYAQWDVVEDEFEGNNPESGDSGTAEGSKPESGDSGTAEGEPETAFGSNENIPKNGWHEVNGIKYWYENGIKQGTEGRGKEIYDSDSDAWYWLDAPDGKMAFSKDVYQESLAGIWGDCIGIDGQHYGKWVRYDTDGHMIKGWHHTDNGIYFFDYTFGTMAKGYATIDGIEYYFNRDTGVLEKELGKVPEIGWKTIDGNDYWYEGYVRQGYSIISTYRGKEIYDPQTDAWYWLDNVDGGKKAVSKDVYQESLAGDWGEIVGEDGQRYGKWVRYDQNGHMVKGWQDTDKGKYFFDYIYGTMAKGEVLIEGKTYYFDVNTGTLQ